MNRLSPPFDPHAALEARIARRIAACLSEHTEQLEPDLSERLRHARERALQAARAARSPALQPVGIGHAAVLGARRAPWWLSLSLALPLLALVCGLITIQTMQATSQIAVAAEVDAALLSDELPPSAYGDPGFAEFLKTTSRL